LQRLGRRAWALINEQQGILVVSDANSETDAELIGL
jgi:hypothetical protein